MLDARGYRLAVIQGSRLSDLRAGTRLRLARGDRAAGLAWRVQNARNYYAARLDLDSHEFVLYKFVRGNRVQLSRLSGLRLNAALWHEITVEHVGNRIRVWLNDIPVASERDAALREPGMVALWMAGRFDGAVRTESGTNPYQRSEHGCACADCERTRLIFAAAVSRLLKDAGFVADVAEDGDAGLTLAQEDVYDLLVLDLMLPGLQGERVLAELRRLGRRDATLSRC